MQFNLDLIKQKLAKNNRVLWQALAVICIIAALFLTAFILLKRPVKVPTAVPKEKPAQVEFKYNSILSGVGVEKEEQISPQVFGVMIDNHPDARPPVGLSSAKVVYEALAEGGITRFMALYSEFQKLAEVGPVRSARPYFIDWLQEYGDAMYLHSGGSPAALKQIKEVDLFDADEFAREDYYWRSATKKRPHNLFTRSDFWLQMLDRLGKDRAEVEWQGWKFSTSSVTEVSGEGVSLVKEIKLNYRPEYTVEWKFDPVSKRYVRSINQELHKDEGGQVILADTILVQEVKVKILDEVGRREITTVGTGDARVLTGGKMVRGTWVREPINDRTRFYNKAGAEVELRPGIIWVQILSQGTEVEVTN
jgi:hypothetical protein